MSDPRAVFTMITPSFICATASALIMALGLRQRGRMERDDVGLAEELLAFDVRHAELRLQLLDDANVLSQDAHVEPVSELSHFSSDLTRSHDADGFAVKRHPLQAVVVEHALIYAAIAFGDMAQRAEKQREHVLGDHVRTVVRHVAHRDATLFARTEVDVVESDRTRAYEP
jgi:hypothetical protein